MQQPPAIRNTIPHTPHIIPGGIVTVSRTPAPNAVIAIVATSHTLNKQLCFIPFPFRFRSYHSICSPCAFIYILFGIFSCLPRTERLYFLIYLNEALVTLPCYLAILNGFKHRAPLLAKMGAFFVSARPYSFKKFGEKLRNFLIAQLLD